jgi:hypothetical protein
MSQGYRKHSVSGNAALQKGMRHLHATVRNPMSSSMVQTPPSSREPPFLFPMNLRLPLLTLAIAVLATPLYPAEQAAAASATTAASAGVRVFVCAHSFMIYTAKLLPPMAQSAGVAHVHAGQQMIGGSRVIQHWNLPDDKNRAKEALREGRVDVITLSPHMELPDEGITNFTKLGLEKNTNLRVLLQASWPARDGHQDKGFKNEQRDAMTPEELKDMRTQHHSQWRTRLEEQARTLNTATGREAVHIIPVSDAVISLRECIVQGKAPGITRQSALFRDPLGHPEPVLATLVTYCHFATIYQRSPEGLPVPEQLKKQPQAEALNKLLQKLAWEAVVNYPMSGVTADTAKRS